MAACLTLESPLLNQRASDSLRLPYGPGTQATKVGVAAETTGQGEVFWNCHDFTNKPGV